MKATPLLPAPCQLHPGKLLTIARYLLEGIILALKLYDLGDLEAPFGMNSCYSGDLEAQFWYPGGPFWHPGAPFSSSSGTQGHPRGHLGVQTWICIDFGWILGASWDHVKVNFVIFPCFGPLSLQYGFLGCFFCDLGLEIAPTSCVGMC